eukprot:17058-Rhodomonas_salina.1
MLPAGHFTSRCTPISSSTSHTLASSLAANLPLSHTPPSGHATHLLFGLLLSRMYVPADLQEADGLTWTRLAPPRAVAVINLCVLPLVHLADNQRQRHVWTCACGGRSGVLHQLLALGAGLAVHVDVDLHQTPRQDRAAHSARGGSQRTAPATRQ